MIQGVFALYPHPKNILSSSSKFEFLVKFHLWLASYHTRSIDGVACMPFAKESFEPWDDSPEEGFRNPPHLPLPHMT
eukprot:3009116-Amphidinium_carterae.1